jgi:hypothetical protein
MPDYKKIPVDITATVNNGAATANDLVVAVAAIYDNLWAVSNTDRDTMQTTQGRAATTRRPTIRDHCRHTNSIRIASSLRADMIFGKDRRLQLLLDDLPAMT